MNECFALGLLMMAQILPPGTSDLGGMGWGVGEPSPLTLPQSAAKEQGRGFLLLLTPDFAPSTKTSLSETWLLGLQEVDVLKKQM